MERSGHKLSREFNPLRFLADLPLGTIKVYLKVGK